MSVSVPDRNESNTEFINQTYELNKKIGSLVSKLSPKYKSIYGDDMAKAGLKALRFLQTGNGIYIDKHTPQLLFDARTLCFNLAKGTIYNIPATYRLCTLVRIEIEKPSKEQKDKWITQSKNVFILANQIVKMIGGVIKSDKERYKKYRKEIAEDFKESLLYNSSMDEDMIEDIKADTSGEYRKLLVKIVGE